MNSKQMERLDLFATNTQAIKKEFVWKDIITKRLAALLYTNENKAIDCNLIRDNYNFIKKNTGALSNFRGDLAICIATMMSLSDNGQERLTDALDLYGVMKKMGFKASDFLVISAFQIASYADKADYNKVIERTKAFYDGMKKNHWFFTGRDDYIFATMLGLSDIDVQTGIDRMERLHKELKSQFRFGNSIQALTQVLVLGGETGETIKLLSELRGLMRDKKIRIDKEYTLTSLGVLSLLPVDVKTIADDLSESYQYLRAKKGFGAWSITKQELLMFSAALVSSGYADDWKDGILTATLSTSITNIIIAQHMAVIAASSAAAAAASASSTS